ncbi:MAG: response regulator [Acidiferrobacterales bacterium]|nr:response regulator [Acidiferrobacterales bacterium]
MDTDSKEMLVDAIDMAVLSLTDALQSEEEPVSEGSLFEDEDAQSNTGQLHQVAIGAFETLKMTGEFANCDLVDRFCEQLSTDFFHFAHDQEEEISTAQAGELANWLTDLKTLFCNANAPESLFGLFAPNHKEELKSLAARFLAEEDGHSEQVEIKNVEDMKPESMGIESSVPNESADGCVSEQVPEVNLKDESIEERELESTQFLEKDEESIEIEAEDAASELKEKAAEEANTDGNLEDSSAENEPDTVNTHSSDDRPTLLVAGFDGEIVRTHADSSGLLTAEETASPLQEAIEEPSSEPSSEEARSIKSDFDSEPATIESSAAERSGEHDTDATAATLGHSDLSDVDAPNSYTPSRNFSSPIEQGVVEILLEELSELEEELKVHLDTMVDHESTEEQRIEAATEYSEQVSRLSEAFTTMGCNGLGLASEFIQSSVIKVSAVSEGSGLDEVKQPLSSWPRLFERYLGEQDREQYSLDIVSLFQSAGWPGGISEPIADEMYIALIAEFDLSESQQSTEERLESATEEAVSLTTDPEVSDNVFQSFLQEAPDLAAQFTQNINSLPNSKDLQSDLKSSQRTIHTIKGLATLVGVNGVTNLSHNVEDILEYLMTAKVEPPEALYETLSESADTLESMLDYLSNRGSFPDNSQRLLDEVLVWARLCDEERLGDFEKESATTSPPTLSSEVFAAAEIKQDVGVLDRSQEADDTNTTAVDETLDRTDTDHSDGEQSVATDEPENLSDRAGGAEETQYKDQDITLPSALEAKHETSGLTGAANIAATPFTVPAAPVLTPVTTAAGTSNTAVAGATGDETRLNVPVSVIDELFRAVGEMSVSIGQMQTQVGKVMRQSSDIRKQHRVIGQRQFELENVIDTQTAQAAKARTDLMSKQAASDFDSLEFDQYGELHSASHAYIETVADMQSMVRDVESNSSALRTLLDGQKQVNALLQSLVTNTRLVSADSLTARLERCVRQASRSTGKKAELELSGSETLVDSETLNQLMNPLLHILRNAVDHGIDSREERIAAGKAEIGRISLSFSSDGSKISVICDDDGKGIDYDGIKQKAIEQGLIDSIDPSDKAELVSLLFLPGVTTRSEATEISGRGFGMDIVNEAVRQMGGNLEMMENDHGGCRVVIEVPVKLVTTHALLVSVCNEVYSIPSSSFEQIITQSMGSLEYVGRELTFFFGDTAYPAVYLADKLGIDRSANADQSNSTILIVKSMTSNTAVVVDEVLANSEIVVKGLGKYLAGVFGHVTGVATLGEGQLVTVLNLAGLLERQQSAALAAGLPTSSARAAAQMNTGNVLIVEDSLSVRNALSDIVEEAGYTPLMAKDGLQALDVIKSEQVSLVLTDLEMPRMDGLELTRQIRTTEDTATLPVLMITSRTMTKHRQQADQAGVTEYITKPFSEDQIVDLIGNHIQAAR